MSKNNYGWVTPVIVLGGLALVGYLLYNWWKNNPISKALDTAGTPGLIPGVVPAVNLWTSIFNPSGTITPQNVAEVSKDIGDLGQNSNPTYIINNPVKYFYNAFGQLPNLISAVKIADITPGVITPKNVASVASSIGNYGKTVTPANILNNPLGVVIGGFAQLPNMIGAVVLGTTAPKVNPSIPSSGNITNKATKIVALDTKEMKIPMVKAPVGMPSIMANKIKAGKVF